MPSFVPFMLQVVIVDEAHERTVGSDVLLGLLKGVQQRRGAGFRLLVMSATLDAAHFGQYFGNPQTLYIKACVANLSMYHAFHSCADDLMCPLLAGPAVSGKGTLHSRAGG